MSIDITVKVDPKLSSRGASNEYGKLTGITVRSLAGPCTNIEWIGMRGKAVKGGFTINTRAFAKLCHKFLAAYVAGGGTFDDLHEEKDDHEEKRCVWCKDDEEKRRRGHE
mgnify:FL=1